MNNHTQGMVKEWEKLFFNGRITATTNNCNPKFSKLAETFGMLGLRAQKIEELDGVIDEMLNTEKPVIADIQVDPKENVFPMIPSGAAHNEMILGPEDRPQSPVSEEGMVLV